MADAFDLASRLLDRWLEKVGPDGKARLHKHGRGKRIRIHSTANSIDLLLEIGEERISIRPAPYTPAGHETPANGNNSGARDGGSYQNGGNYAGGEQGGGDRPSQGGGNHAGGLGVGGVGGQAASVDLDVEFNLAILASPALGLGAAQWRERGWLRINGDVNFAEKLLDISGDMPAGLGDVAQPFIGKTGALMLDQLIEFIRDIFGRAVGNLRMDVVDYLQYQGGILTDPASMNEFNEQTEQLMRDIDTLEKRLDKLDHQT